MTQQKPFLTTNPALHHRDVYHALQGNGPGTPGQYFRGLTWCGLDLGDEGEESTHGPTCGECLDARDQHDNAMKARKE
ncbi:MAG: hypothetical protein ABIJ57_01725 [Pseudomonadota bacterium]